MRIYTVSDLHVDYAENLRWVEALSKVEYQEDVLICAGDISANDSLFKETLYLLRARFMRVFFVPGNHDIWVRKEDGIDSITRFEQLIQTCSEIDIDTAAAQVGGILIVPIFSWYDFSFAPLKPELKKRWADFRMCKWPAGMSHTEVTNWFHKRTEIPEKISSPVISFSHYLPEIDMLPDRIDPEGYLLTAVLGSESLGEIVKSLKPHYHICGHSHVNSISVIGQTTYINNAYGYPSERNIAKKELMELSPLPK
ncbi:MAG: Icc-related predicted phosphoesterase [Limisphaerales bacterium]|jgi:Icc-related predicted phosphoesterase